MLILFMSLPTCPCCVACWERMQAEETGSLPHPDVHQLVIMIAIIGSWLCNQLLFVVKLLLCRLPSRLHCSLCLGQWITLSGLESVGCSALSSLQDAAVPWSLTALPRLPFALPTWPLPAFAACCGGQVLSNVQQVGPQQTALLLELGCYMLAVAGPCS